MKVPTANREQYGSDVSLVQLSIYCKVLIEFVLNDVFPRRKAKVQGQIRPHIETTCFVCLRDNSLALGTERMRVRNDASIVKCGVGRRDAHQINSAEIESVHAIRWIGAHRADELLPLFSRIQP